MLYDWYNLFSLPEFLATNLVSRNLLVNMESIGQKEILITRGNEVAVVYEDVFLVINMEGDNPFKREGIAANYAVYLDADQNVWLGIETES